MSVTASVVAVLGRIERWFAPAREVLRPALSDTRLLAAWGVLVAGSLAVLWWDVRARNRSLPSLMKFVWTLVVLYSGPLGVAVYWYAGRTQIPEDSLWRRGCRSTAHCYSGCGAGEVVGIALLSGALALSGTLVVPLGTFACAYFAGFALTVGPLVQEGETLGTAVTDAVYSETPSITVMEAAAIGTDLLLAPGATMADPLFWSALVFSLSVGFLAAYPVNVGLIRGGVKEGMGNPAAMG